jgi:hypothetical protein
MLAPIFAVTAGLRNPGCTAVMTRMRRERAATAAAVTQASATSWSGP